MSQLQIPGITMVELGATVVGPVDTDAVETALGRLAYSETWTRWVVGDLFLALVDAAGGDPAPAYQAVAGRGFDPAWLNTSVLVAQRVPHRLRTSSLSWGHHEQVARDGLDEDMQARFLDLAVGPPKLTVRQLAEQVTAWLTRDQGQLDGVEPTPVFRLAPATVRRIGAVAASVPSGWVLVHPESGRVVAPTTEAIAAVETTGREG